MVRKTKIVCTLGPAVDDDQMMRELMLAGMDCARLNFSHGLHPEQLERIKRVKKIRQELNLPIPIMLDTKGPEIRLGSFEGGCASLIQNDEIVLSADPSLIGNSRLAPLSYSKLAQSVKPGDEILIDDGKVALEVKEIQGKDIICSVKNSGVIKDRKSINIPGVAIDMPYISKQDKDDILFGIEQGVDFIAASFVRSAQDVLELRALLKVGGGEDIKIISKIENTQGIRNIDEILAVSDGIMVARGDMGVEVPFRELPAIQKEIIHKCYYAGKHVVTATQMLESMTHNPRPTRAEVSDVANAIYDGTTAIMLSGESAAGDYPIQSVRTMADIAVSTESAINYAKRFHTNNLRLGMDTVDAIAGAACGAAYQLPLKAIVAVSRSGRTVSLVSAYRPSCPIIAAVVDERVCRQLNLSWNVIPIMAQEQPTTDKLFYHGVEKAAETGIVGKGDLIAITTGSVIGSMSTDTLKLHTV